MSHMRIIPSPSAAERAHRADLQQSLISPLRIHGASLHLIVGRPSASEERESPASRDSYAGGLHAVNVLVIDDDEDTRDLLATIIERAGFSVETARDGSDALHRLRAVRPELIFLDIQMPVLDGPSFRQEQRRNRDLIWIPTVVMTGSNDETQLDPAIAVTLRKPVRGKDLLAIVRRYCTPKV